MSDRVGLSDAVLVEQAKQGNTSAFGVLYERYASKVFRFLLGRIGNRQDAEDLTTEVFVRVWKYIPKFNDQGLPFSSFVFQVSRNLLIDTYRKKHHDAFLEQDPPIPDIEATNDEEINTGITLEDIRNGLNDLPEDYQTVLTLRFFNNFSPKEISEIMQRSEGAIRILQFRALTALRKRLDKIERDTH